jgi:predicted permease
MHSVRLSLRALVVSPGLTAAVVLTIGVAVAANAALFAVFDGLVFRPLPFRDADRLVHLEVPPSSPTFGGAEWKRLVDATETSALFTERDGAQRALLFDRTGEAALGWGLRPFRVTSSFFEMLGVRPMLGRAVVEADSEGPPFTVVLGHDIWRARFGADPSILNTTVSIPGTSPRDRWLVVGVMPPGFDFPQGANLWIPYYRFWAPMTDNYVRLADGVSVDQVRAQLPGLIVTPLREHVRPRGAAALAVLLAATALLLLVAWVQVAGLWLSRMADRTREIGVRLALGAGRSSLLRQFALESGLIVGAALALGWLAAPALVALIAGLLPPEMMVGQHVGPDGRTFLFTAGLAAIGLLVLSILPADIIRRASPLMLLRGEATGGIRLRSTRTRTALFVAQLAVTVAVLYLAGLAFRSFVNVSRVPIGFDPSGVVAVRMPGSGAPVGARIAPGEAQAALGDQRRLVRETMAALEALPQVARVSGSHHWPMQTTGPDSVLIGRSLFPESDPGAQPLEGLTAVAFPDYAAVLGLRVLEGAEATRDDLAAMTGPGTIQLALANRTLARHLEAHGPPVGQIVALNRALRYRIVGVIDDSRQERPSEPVKPTLFTYIPDVAVPAVLLARLRPEAAGADEALRGALARVWGDRAPRDIVHLADAVRHANADYRARTYLLGLIVMICLPLAVIGVAGALGYATRQRAREIAIEIAIGADPAAIRRRVVSQAVTAASVALGAGVAAGAAIGQVLSAFLFGVRALDAMTTGGAAVVILAVVWLSALRPARRAAAISPALALRDP